MFGRGPTTVAAEGRFEDAGRHDTRLRAVGRDRIGCDGLDGVPRCGSSRGESVTTAGTDRPTVAWRRRPADRVASPVLREVPYLELKLEHPDLDPTGRGERFFPDAVPYELGDDRRVFYWRPSLEASTADPADWRLACATTHGLAGADDVPAPAPALTTDGAVGTAVVVEGAVAGDATTAHLGSYSPPTVRVRSVSASTVGVVADGHAHEVSAGDRERISLSEREVRPVDADGASTPTAVTPVLAVRFPGRRAVHHPAPGADYRLFPSFGVTLDDLPNPVPVPTTVGELDAAALAERVGVDPSARPYPERVLWQAFAHTAFDPHADADPTLAQLSSGHLVVHVDGGDDATA